MGKCFTDLLTGTLDHAKDVLKFWRTFEQIVTIDRYQSTDGSLMNVEMLLGISYPLLHRMAIFELGAMDPESLTLEFKEITGFENARKKESPLIPITPSMTKAAIASLTEASKRFLDKKSGKLSDQGVPLRNVEGQNVSGVTLINHGEPSIQLWGYVAKRTIIKRMPAKEKRQSAHVLAKDLIKKKTTLGKCANFVLRNGKFGKIVLIPIEQTAGDPAHDSWRSWVNAGEESFTHGLLS